jgi:hypothetical protein
VRSGSFSVPRDWSPGVLFVSGGDLRALPGCGERALADGGLDVCSHPGGRRFVRANLPQRSRYSRGLNDSCVPIKVSGLQIAFLAYKVAHT